MFVIHTHMLGFRPYSKLASGESSLADTKEAGKEVKKEDDAGSVEEDAKAIKPEVKAEVDGEAAVKQEPAAGTI